MLYEFLKEMKRKDIYRLRDIYDDKYNQTLEILDTYEEILKTIDEILIERGDI